MSSKRKTRASDAAIDTPDTKRQKANEVETPENTQTLGYQLLKHAKASRDKRNHIISTEFLTLPDEEEVPDYYEVIKMPIAIDTIEEKVATRKYPTLTTLESDFKRMVQNAKDYNEKESEICADAEKIRKLVSNFMTKNNPAYRDPDYVPFPTPIPGEDDENDEEAAQPKATPGRRGSRRKSAQAPEAGSVEKDGDAEVASNGTNANRERRALTLNGPRSTSAAAPEDGVPPTQGSGSGGPGFRGKTFQEAQETLLDELLDFTNDDGVDISGPFENLPSRDLKDYYQIIKRAVSLRSVQRQVKGQQGRGKATGQTVFKSWQALADELDFIWNNAKSYNEEGSEIYEAAGELEAHFYNRLEQAKALVQEPAQPKVTLRVQAEPSTKLRLHLSNRSGPAEGYSVDPEALKRQQDIVAAGASGDARMSSRGAEEATTAELKSGATPDTHANGIKAETVVSQSPPAPSGVRAGSTASGEVRAPSANGSVPPTTGDTVVEGSPAPSQPRAPPPPPARDPLESRLRPSGKGVADALITNFVISSHPSLPSVSPFRLTVPPSAQLSQQSITVTVPESVDLLRVVTTFPSSLFQRPHKIILRLNKGYLTPIQTRANDTETFDVNLRPGTINVLELEVLASLNPRGAPKIGAGTEYEYERITTYLNASGQ